MAQWYYYNENDDKIQVTGGQLKGLAKAGVINPDTIIETEEGKKARAGKVKGLTFLEGTLSAGTGSRIKNMTETLEEQDFEQLREDFAWLQEREQAKAQKVVMPPPPPIKSNPFTSASLNPPTVHVPTINQTVSQSVAEPATMGGKNSLLVTLIGFLIMLTVGGVGWVIIIQDTAPQNEQRAAPPSDAFWLAVREGTIQDVRHFIEGGVDVNVRDQEFGWTPLHFAVGFTNINVARYLIERGANVNAKSNEGMTPLHLVAPVMAVGGKLEYAMLLIENGADISAKNSAGDTPLDIIVKVSSIITDTALNVIHRAALLGNLEAQETLGVLYFQRENYREAMTWLKMVAEQGVVEAYFLTGTCYHELGEGVEAMRWFRRGAELGCDKAQEALAICLRGLWRSTETESHRIEARQWMQRAVAQGNQDAINTLREWEQEDTTRAAQEREAAAREARAAQEREEAALRAQAQAAADRAAGELRRRASSIRVGQDNPNRVRLTLGEPHERGRPGPDTWYRYRAGGTTVTVTFNRSVVASVDVD
jgi:tetratricopeptide (TPR) repeat protein